MAATASPRYSDGMAAARQRKILAIIASDRTFERGEVRGEPVWVGKCLMCNRRLIVSATGAPISEATIEHIVPRNHGGTDELANLALACARCNRGKGKRHDARRRDDPRRREVVAALQARRRERWREP